MAAPDNSKVPTSTSEPRQIGSTTRFRIDVVERRQVEARRLRDAFTLVELLVVIAIIGILIALLLPAVQAAREAARRAQCINNLKQLGLGLQNYHDVNGAFPLRRGGTSGCSGWTGGNCTRVSGFIPLLPFIEQQALYDQIKAGGPNGAPPYGPPGWYGWSSWNVQAPGLLCPSDSMPRPGAGAMGHTNYAFSQGDSINNNLNATSSRGMFCVVNSTRLNMVTDGTSNTILMSERIRANFGIGGMTRVNIRQGTATSITNLTTSPGVCLTTATGTYFNDPTIVKGRFGTLYTDGQMERCGFTTVLPPNSPSCVADANIYADSGTGVYAPSSNHPAGVNGVMADGSVRFINDSINVGNLASPEASAGPSPYGIWGAMGSKNGEEGAMNGA